jgi:hypothetical protein
MEDTEREPFEIIRIVWEAEWQRELLMEVLKDLEIKHKSVFRADLSGVFTVRVGTPKEEK